MLRLVACRFDRQAFDLRTQMRGQGERGLLRGVLAQHQEFLAAPARDQVARIAGSAQAARDLHQHPVAAVEADAVVVLADGLRSEDREHVVVRPHGLEDQAGHSSTHEMRLP